MDLDPVSHLLAYMVIAEIDNGSPELVPQWMRNAGHSQEEVTQALNGARTEGLIVDEGFGRDTLTETGRARGVDALRILEPARDISFDQPPVTNEAATTSSSTLPITRM